MKTFQIHATVTHKTTGQSFELHVFLLEAMSEYLAASRAELIVNPFYEYEVHIVATERVGDT